MENDADDVGFISNLIDYLIKDYNINSKRVYITGMSNGAMMSFRLACELSDKITAIAPVAGYMPFNLKDFKPKNCVSVLLIANTEDNLVPYNGGDIGLFKKNRGKVLSVKQSISFWIDNNKCSKNVEKIQLPKKNNNDPTKVEIYKYSSCNKNTQVILYKIINGGHTWPGGSPYLSEKIIGITSTEINACEIIWDFFKDKKK